LAHISIPGDGIFSIAGVLDKLLLENYTYDSKAYIVCQALVQLIFIIPVMLFVGVKFTYPESLFALLLGCLQIFPTFFYMKALQIEEASKVSAMEYAYPVFVLIGSIFLFGEILSPKCYAGGLLLIIGTLFYPIKGTEESAGFQLASIQRLKAASRAYPPRSGHSCHFGSLPLRIISP